MIQEPLYALKIPGSPVRFDGIDLSRSVRSDILLDLPTVDTEDPGHAFEILIDGLACTVFAIIETVLKYVDLPGQA
jgi:hypothetical protein